LRGRFWISSVIAAAISAAVLPRSGFSQPADQAGTSGTPVPAPSAPDPLTVLTNSRASAEARNAAARKLVAAHSPDSRRHILELLSDSRAPLTQAAVAQALADDPDPDPAFVEPLFTMLAAPGLPGVAARQALGIYRTGDVRGRILATLISDATGASGIRSEFLRPNATLALGQLVDREAAQTLINLLTNSQEIPEIRQNATKALAAMSGNSRIGDDPQGWQRWWTAQSTDPAQFRNDLLTAQSVQLSILKRHFNDLESSYSSSLYDTYHNIPANDAEQRKRKLLDYLTADDAVQRAEGARIVSEDKQNGLPLPPLDDVLKQLERMIGDESPTVRLAVADAISLLNDPAAVPLLLAQLNQETDPTVKASLARALGQIGDLQSVKYLIPLLSDSHDVVAAAAAKALASFGSRLQNLPRPLASDAAAQLHNIFDLATPGSQLRVAIISAMAELRDQTLLRVFKKILDDPNENAQMKIKAIDGIGNLKDTDSADDIGRELRDPDAGIKAAAARALRNVNGVSYVRPLAAMLQPGQEDPSVQSEAETSFLSFVPDLDVADLQNYADTFGQNHQYNLQVKCLAQICDKLRQSGKPADLADLPLAQMNLGDSMLKLDPPDYNGAVGQYSAAIAALESDKVKPNNVRMVALQRRRLEASLRSGKYPEAMGFAQQAIESKALESGEVGEAIKNEVERLKTEANQNAVLLEQAMKLIDESTHIDLPMNKRENLNDLKTMITQQMDRSKGSGFTAPGPSQIEANIGATARK